MKNMVKNSPLQNFDVNIADRSAWKNLFQKLSKIKLQNPKSFLSLGIPEKQVLIPVIVATKFINSNIIMEKKKFFPEKVV